MIKRERWRSITLFSIVLLLFGVQAAQAHSQLTSSVPTRNQFVTTLPPLVWLEFDEHLMSVGSTSINRLTVVNSKNIRVDVGGTVVKGARISTKLKTGLTPGKYRVFYRIVSEDGHPVEGSYAFTYRPK